jgi:signal transduction histidine kinase/ActR/RegA family two-component response regulator
MNEISHQPPTLLRSLARTSAGLVVLWCPIVLAGWALDLPVLTSFASSLARMSVPTALCFLLCGIAILQITYRKRFPHTLIWLRQLPSAIVLLLSLYTLAGYLGEGPSRGYTFGPHLGQVAPATAINFLLLSAALLLSNNRAAQHIYSGLIAIGMMATSLDLLGYAFDVNALYHVLPFAAMALPTALAFILLFFAALVARPSFGWTARMIAEDSGGVAARRMLLPVLIIPIILAWLVVEAVQRGMFPAPFGFAILAVSTGVTLAVIIYFASALLGRRDIELTKEVVLRREAQRKLQTQLDRLNLLNQITRAISEHQDISSIYQVVIGTLEDQLPIDFASIYLADPSRQFLSVQHVGAKSMPLAEEAKLQERTRVEIDANGMAQCMRGHLIYEPRITDLNFPFPRRLSAIGLKSLVMSPLQIDDDVFGVLMAGRAEAEAFSSSDCEFLGQLSQHVALATNQAALHASLQRAYDELRQSQQEAMQQERLRALGQMASGIAHDINNAISPVSLQTQALLENDATLTPPMQTYLSMVNRQMNDVSETIGRLREFYREREETQNLAPVDLNHLCRDIIELSRARWSDMARRDGTTIEVQTDLSPDLPFIQGKDNELREAMINLIFNAVDAMPDGGTITVRTRLSKDAEYIVLEVADTGIGMSEATKRRAMEPFFTTKKERGTGLGLAMVYGVLKRHEARVDITTAQDVGTTFTLTFPVSHAPAPATAKPETKQIPAPMRLLLIDDDPYVLDSLCTVLEIDKHVVTGKTSGQEGLNAFEAAMNDGQPFDAVITDLGMPYMDGHQVARMVKSASPSTPVIMLTGWGQRMADSEGNDVTSNVDYVLGKPPLLRKLREVLLRAQTVVA